MKDLAIILLNYNGSEDTIECIKSLDESVTKYSYNVFIMDNNSKITEVNVLKNYFDSRSDYHVYKYEEFIESKIRGNLLILSDENAGFARGNNKIINAIYKEYEYILLLNNDTVVTKNFIEEIIHMMESDNNIGYASCRIDNYYDHSLLWNCGGILRPWGLREYYTARELEEMPEIIPAEFITGCALFIRSLIIEKYGALSDDFFHGEEDFNFCWRMKKNHIQGKCINKTMVYHKVSATSNMNGVKPGKMVAYYVYRVVDMKQFYSKIVWLVWKSLLMILLKMKWKKAGISSSDLKKMYDILRRASRLDSLNKNDTLKIWDLTF